LSCADVGARDGAVDAFEARLARDLDVDIAESNVAERFGVLADRDRPRDAPGPQVKRALHLGRELRESDHVRNSEPASWCEDAVRLTEVRARVRGEVDHAVGDHDVDARIWQ